MAAKSAKSTKPAIKPDTRSAPRPAMMKAKKTKPTAKPAAKPVQKSKVPVKKTGLAAVKEQVRQHVKAVATKVKSQVKELTQKKAETSKTPAPAPTVQLTKGKGKGSKVKVESTPRGPAPLGSITAASRAAANDGNCREVACDLSSTSGGYCRLHYIKNWKKIKRKELILKEGRLNEYVEELVKKYPDKYIEAIRQDLAEDKDFSKVVTELELDESLDEFDGDSENIDSLIDNIRRDMDDDGDTF